MCFAIQFINTFSTYLHKVGVFGIPYSDHCMNLFNQLLFLIVIKMHVPFGKTGFASPILNKYKANLK